MKLLRTNNGFTLIELCVIIVICVIVLVFGIIVPQANVWFTEDGVKNRLEKKYQVSIEIIESERNVFKKSKITIRINGRKEEVIYLDTNVLLDKKFFDSE